MAAVGNVGVDAFLLGVRHGGATVIARIGGHLGLLEYLWGNLRILESCACALQHGLK